MLRKTLITLLFFITVFSGVISLMLMIEPSGILISHGLPLLTDVHVNNFIGIGLLIFIMTVLPGMICLVKLMGINRYRYHVSFFYGLLQFLIGIVILRYLSNNHWVVILFIIITFFILLMSYQLKGNKLM